MSSDPIVCLTLICSPRLKDDDLAGRVGLQVKELNKLMATLEKDGLIQACAFSLYLGPHKGPTVARCRHRQNELKEGAQRSVGRQYFYVDYKRFCNVIKWRVAEMHRVIDTGLRNVSIISAWCIYAVGPST